MSHPNIEDYINQKKELQNLIYDIVLNEVNEDYTQLFSFIQHEKYLDNKDEFREFIYFMSKLSNNHNRVPKFISKIQQILLFTKEQIKQNFSNYEIYNFFKGNRLIVLFLIQSEILKIDKLLSLHIYESKHCYFYYPEIKPFLDEIQINWIEKELKKTDETILDHFEDLRKEGQNHSYISKLIRNDSIDEFVVYFNQHNLTCSNTKIIQSIFETNSFLIDKSLTLIEYAAFFGSIQIFNFLQLKNAEMKPSLWFYVIHSQNAELVLKLEELRIPPPKNSFITCLCESIKCHHNNISDYIKNNLIEDQISNERSIIEYEYENEYEEFEEDEEEEEEDDDDEERDEKCTESIFDSCFRYHNYEYFPSDFNDKCILFYLCKYDYLDLLKISFDDEKLDYRQQISIRPNGI